MATSANLGIDNPTYANAIAEPVIPGTTTPGPAAANIKYSGSGNARRHDDLAVPRLHAAAGYTVAKAELRASYDSNNSCTNFFGSELQRHAVGVRVRRLPGFGR